MVVLGEPLTSLGLEIGRGNERLAEHLEHDLERPAALLDGRLRPAGQHVRRQRGPRRVEAVGRVGLLDGRDVIVGNVLALTDAIGQFGDDGLVVVLILLDGYERLLVLGVGPRRGGRLVVETQEPGVFLPDGRE